MGIPDLKPDGINFRIFGKELQEVADNFDGCPLKDAEGNIIGKVIKVTYDGEVMKCEAKLD